MLLFHPQTAMLSCPWFLCLQVYKATWRGTVVAVKIMVLPSHMSGKEKREKMAIMVSNSATPGHGSVIMQQPAALHLVHHAAQECRCHRYAMGHTGRALQAASNAGGL